jgi:hypothetical protein
VSTQAASWPDNKAKLIASKDRILFLELVAPLFDSKIESILKEASEEFDLLVKLANPNDLKQILSLPIAGISLEGSAEVSVGLKEYPLAEILEKLEEE